MCLAYRACTRLVLAPIASAICLLVIVPPAFWRAIHAAFDSSSFLTTLTLRPPPNGGVPAQAAAAPRRAPAHPPRPIST